MLVRLDAAETHLTSAFLGVAWWVQHASEARLPKLSQAVTTCFLASVVLYSVWSLAAIGANDLLQDVARVVAHASFACSDGICSRSIKSLGFRCKLQLLMVPDI